MGDHQLVVVAIPSENDPVWKYSSEQVPHLTLLYLGQADLDQTEFVHVAQYIEHASQTLCRFMLDVSSRGPLGPDPADVLFFNKKFAKEITEFRENLLKDPIISKAYLSVDQFPEWTPHLTMGYPSSPAKEDTRDYPGFSYVNFDRVALWTGDYEGLTYPLKTHDYDLEVAMSQTEKGRVAVGSVLAHYGVKGMKWGVTNADRPSGKTSASDDHKQAVAAERTINRSGTKALSNKELQNLINRKNLERQYNSMLAQEKTSLDKGHEQIAKILKLGKTYNDVVRFLDTDAGKRVKQGFKVAGMAAKVGAAYATGGTSAAAGAAGTIAVRRMANHYTNVR